MRALITGITGQDGSYLSELLLEKGYEVHGLVRRAAVEDPADRAGRIHHIANDLVLHGGDLQVYASVFDVVRNVMPDECYHLGAQSFVKESFDSPFDTFQINAVGTLHLLEALRHLAPKCRFYFAGTSEMFGNASTNTPQSEETPLDPQSPYAISKVAGFQFTRMYRQAYKLFACSGILFNHESPRRGVEFVTRKITMGVAAISLGKAEKLHLGNLDAKRDWGFAGDYVKAMWLMLQQDKPDDYVVGSGKAYSVRDFVKAAFGAVNLDYEKHIVIDPKFFRPAEVHVLHANPTKARKVLQWRPNVSFEDLVVMMVEHDVSKYVGEKGEQLR